VSSTGKSGQTFASTLLGRLPRDAAEHAFGYLAPVDRQTVLRLVCRDLAGWTSLARCYVAVRGCDWGVWMCRLWQLLHQPDADRAYVERLDLLVSCAGRPEPLAWRSLCGTIGRHAFPGLRELVVRGCWSDWRPPTDDTNPLDLLAGAGDDPPPALTTLRLYDLRFRTPAPPHVPAIRLPLPLPGLTTLCLRNLSVTGDGGFATLPDATDDLRSVGLLTRDAGDWWPTVAADLSAVYVRYRPTNRFTEARVLDDAFAGTRLRRLTIDAALSDLSKLDVSLRPPSFRRTTLRPLDAFRLVLHADRRRCEDNHRCAMQSVVRRLLRAGWLGAAATEVCVELRTRNGFVGVPGGYWLDGVAALSVARRYAVVVWGVDRPYMRLRGRFLRQLTDGAANMARACGALDLRVDVIVRSSNPFTFVTAAEVRGALTGRTLLVPERERALVARGELLRLTCELVPDKGFAAHPEDVDREMQWL
jgi:hypothetical protein